MVAREAALQGKQFGTVEQHKLGHIYLWVRFARKVLNQYQHHCALLDQHQQYAHQFYLPHPMQVGQQLHPGLLEQDAASLWPHKWSSFPAILDDVALFRAHRGDLSDIAEVFAERREEVTSLWLNELRGIGRDMGDRVGGVEQEEPALPSAENQPERVSLMIRPPAITSVLRCAYAIMILSRDKGYLLAAQVSIILFCCLLPHFLKGAGQINSSNWLSTSHGRARCEQSCNN